MNDPYIGILSTDQRDSVLNVQKLYPYYDYRVSSLLEDILPLLHVLRIVPGKAINKLCM